MAHEDAPLIVIQRQLGHRATDAIWLLLARGAPRLLGRHEEKEIVMT
jgi:hypothetical protein